MNTENNYQEFAIGKYCFTTFMMIRWKPELFKRVIEIFTFAKDIHIETKDTTKWVLIPVNGGKYSVEYDNRCEKLVNALSELGIEAPRKTILANNLEELKSIEDFQLIQHIKDIEKYYN